VDVSKKGPKNLVSFEQNKLRLNIGAQRQNNASEGEATARADALGNKAIL